MSTEFQLNSLINSSSKHGQIDEVKRLYVFHYHAKDFKRITKTYEFISKLFKGKIKGYRSCNTEYHDLSHTLDALLAAMRLIDGYNIKNSFDEMPVEIAENLLMAALLHDTGYIQESWDSEGTGAKYTSNHVSRSIEFVEKNMKALKLSRHEVEQISLFITCTGLSINIDSLNMENPLLLTAGYILGSSDLMGQMSDRQYLEKLLFLYREFKEAGITGYDTEFDIIKKTIYFYDMAMKRLTECYKSVYEFASIHFNERFDIDKNLYMEAISRHIVYLHAIIEDNSTNFRHKLKRAEWVHDDEAVH